MPSPQSQFIDHALTDVSVRFTNNEFIADKVFPVAEVDKESGVYFVYDKSNLRIEQAGRTGMAQSREVDYGTTEAPYGPLTEHSLKVGIEKRTLAQYDDPLNPRTDATETVTEMLMLEKERNLAITLSNPAIVTQNITLSGTSQFNDYANSDPFTVIQAAIDSIALNGIKMPNTMVMGYQVWSMLKNHPDLIARVLYGGGGNVKQLTTQMLAELFGLDNVFISKAVYNSAAEGLTATNAFVWGKNIQVMYVEKGSNIRSITAGRTLTLKGMRAVYNWEETSEPGIGEWVKVTDYYEQKVVAAEAIYAILAAIA